MRKKKEKKGKKRKKKGKKSQIFAVILNTGAKTIDVKQYSLKLKFKWIVHFSTKTIRHLGKSVKMCVFAIICFATSYVKIVNLTI